jgi:DNA polymerase-1
MAEIYPQIARLKLLRKTMAKVRLNSIVLGADGRIVPCSVSWVASTGRNAHQAGRLIFRPSRWLRGLVQPTPGSVLVYLDWSAQEFVIAAALSGEQHMLAAIASADPYMWFARMARLVPEWGDPQNSREPFERSANGAASACSMAWAIARWPCASDAQSSKPRNCSNITNASFSTFWAWSDRAVHEATYYGYIDLAFGWRIHHGTKSRHNREDTGPTTLMNARCRAMEPRCYGWPRSSAIRPGSRSTPRCTTH